jgi:hypothetical protein
MQNRDRRESPKNPLFSGSEEEGSFEDSTSEIYEDEENLDVEEYSMDDDYGDDMQGRLN